MEMELLKIHRNQISINARDLLSILGNSGGEMDQHTMELIEKYIVECKEIMTPMGGYVLFAADGLELKEEIEIEGMRFHIGKILKRMLRSSELYALFAVTAGPEPETLSKWLALNDTVRTRLQRLPTLRTEGLWDCQVKAVQTDTMFTDSM